ncbi:MAG: cob(I)yrinic acid a,c-diamide adenosyltransferase [Muribaculaceae bacterium]|nr:cob(I)yrinic acid a,c-diamide adenosyltransferase [Muribaculaceae bacterium]
MKIYTRTGDTGSTSLVGGKRVSKDSPRLEAYGTTDELNSFLGLLATAPDLPPHVLKTIALVQNKIFNIGAYLATDNSATPLAEPSGLGQEHIEALENAIDELTAPLPPLTSFILPTGSRTAAIAHVCRSVCRRAERRVITLAQSSPVDERVIRFLNRLSDYLFTLARYANCTASVAETPWDPGIG